MKSSPMGADTAPAPAGGAAGCTGAGGAGAGAAALGAVLLRGTVDVAAGTAAAGAIEAGRILDAGAGAAGATGAGLGAAAARALAQLAKPGAATRGVSLRGAGLGGAAAGLGGAGRAAAWAQPGDLCGWAALAAASLAAAAVRAAVFAIGTRVEARACASFGAALGAPRADPASGCAAAAGDVGVRITGGAAAAGGAGAGGGGFHTQASKQRLGGASSLWLTHRRRPLPVRDAGHTWPDEVPPAVLRHALRRQLVGHFAAPLGNRASRRAPSAAGLPGVATRVYPYCRRNGTRVDVTLPSGGTQLQWHANLRNSRVSQPAICIRAREGLTIPLPPGQETSGDDYGPEITCLQMPANRT